MWERSGTNTKQVSRTLEVGSISWYSVEKHDNESISESISQYAFDDFTIAQVAKILNLPNDASKVTSSLSDVDHWVDHLVNLVCHSISQF